MEAGERDQFPSQGETSAKPGSGGVQATVKHNCSAVGSALEGVWVPEGW